MNQGVGDETTPANVERFGTFSTACILLVSADGPLGLLTVPKLGEHARAALGTDDSEVYASHVSLWEMATKRSIGKLQLDRRAADWFDHFVTRSGLRQLPIAASHLGGVEGLPPLHNDPFDRLLVAQARHEGFAVVTIDSQVAQYDIDVIW